MSTHEHTEVADATTGETAPSEQAAPVVPGKRKGERPSRWRRRRPAAETAGPAVEEDAVDEDDAPSEQPVEPTDETDADTDVDTETTSARWWQTEHPVFAPLAGFFTGLGVTILVLGAFGAIMRQFFGSDTAERTLPFTLLFLIVPLALVAAPRTRRFGLYMLIGMISTAVIVLGVGVATLFFLLGQDN